jgi:hypothetical protein
MALAFNVMLAHILAAFVVCVVANLQPAIFFHHAIAHHLWLILAIGGGCEIIGTGVQKAEDRNQKTEKSYIHCFKSR